ncbi:MAG: lipoate--protein ligase [Oscillospiraceae bacterium]|nr:lipoate--protein ligase [Oscillospiraceae bacterium]
MALKILDLYTTDAAWNLAAEQYVFENMPREDSYFMLWQNKKAVIIGKYQNTQAEINPAYIHDEQVQVIRRLSGGGAVYHDLGNLNFSFITDANGRKHIDMAGFCRPVIETLRELGVDAELNGRNDMTVNGQKFSGNAQYLRQGRVMHHGTILYDSDLSAVSRALHVDQAKIQSKGIASVRSRVTNIRPLLPIDRPLSDFRELLLTHMLKQTSGSMYSFSAEDTEQIEQIRRSRYARWDWNYGSSPACDLEKSRRIDGCGTVRAFITLDKGCIRSLQFQGDFFSAEEPELLAKKLIGQALTEEALLDALSQVDLSQFFSGINTESFISLLLY